MRKVAGVILGMIAGFVVVMGVEFASHLLYPMPAGLEMSDQAGMKAWIKELPSGAFLMVLLAHAMGAFVGAMTCRIIVGSRWLPGTLIIGGLLLAGGIVNLLMIPHPTWFAIVDVLIYLPAAFLGQSVVRNLGLAKDAIE